MTKHPTTDYAQIAARYMRLTRTGTPTTALAAELDVPKNTAAQLVHRARRLGHLPPAPGKGKGIGRLGLTRGCSTCGSVFPDHQCHGR